MPCVGPMLCVSAHKIFNYFDTKFMVWSNIVCLCLFVVCACEIFNFCQSLDCLICLKLILGISFYLPEVLQINYLYRELWHGIWSSSNASISWSQGLSCFTAKLIQYDPNLSLQLKDYLDLF